MRLGFFVDPFYYNAKNSLYNVNKEMGEPGMIVKELGVW